MRLNHSWLRTAVVCGAVLLFLMPLMRYRALHSAYFDLGQYATNYAMAALDGLWGIAFRSHAHPIMLAFAPVFRLVPRVETLLVLQSATLVVGLWVYARLWRTIGAGDPWAGAALMCVSISIWSVALFDYHFEHVLFPLYPLFFLRLEQNGPRVRLELAAIALAICLVKENYALTGVMLGAFLFFDRRHARLGVIIAVAALAYFLLATMRIIPAFSDGRQAGDLWHDAFAYLGRTPIEILLNVLLRPWVLIEAGLLSTRKLTFVAAIAIPFLLAFRKAPLLLLPALPHVAIMLLSRSENHSYLANQYTVPIVLPVLVAMAYAVARLDRIEPRALTLPAVGPLRALPAGTALAFTGSLAVLVLFGLAPGSRLFLSPSIWSFNSSAYLRTSRDAMVEEHILRHVPADTAVAVASQNTLNHSRLSVRTHGLAFPQGVFEPVKVLRAAAMRTHGPGAAVPESARTARRADASQHALESTVHVDYVVLDLKRPWYVYDRPAPAGSETAREFERLVARLPQEFEQVASQDGLQVWKRRGQAAN